jgi:ornithine cyclodeaminase/alanine dehydrogenase-like protein (mu-crystallin family)
LPFAALIAGLRAAFAAGAEVPPRHHHAIARPDGRDATLLLMPAWDAAFLGVKIVSVFPENSAKGLPGLHSTYLLSDGTSGVPLALIDGNEITGRRTVGVAALAADFLARRDASRLLIVGSGRIAAIAPAAFRAVRPIAQVEVWDRTPAKAAALAERLCGEGFDAAPAASLEAAAGRADIVSCATLATVPLIQGAWLRPGTHLDLIGSFSPEMREADDACFAGARLFVDTSAALSEAGELVQTTAAGVIDGTAGTLADLCAGRIEGRRSADERTVFKAVGTALSDIAAATLAYRG